MGLTGALIILSLSCFLYLLFFPFSLLLHSRSCFHSRTSFLSYSQLLLHHLLRALLMLQVRLSVLMSEFLLLLDALRTTVHCFASNISCLARTGCVGMADVGPGSE